MVRRFWENCENSFESIWANTINTKEYWRTEVVLVQRKAALRCVTAYCFVSMETFYTLAGILPDKNLG